MCTLSFCNGAQLHTILVLFLLWGTAALLISLMDLSSKLDEHCIMGRNDLAHNQDLMCGSLGHTLLVTENGTFLTDLANR